MKIESKTILNSEEYLRQVSTEVDLSNYNIENDIKILEEYCEENEVMAMATIQLGIPKRIIYLKNTNIDIINRIQENNESEIEKNYNEKRVLINPQIIKREGLTTYWEACASCLDFVGLVKRPYKILLEYIDLNGKKHIETFVGFEATVLSHEYDHLNGILHIDIADKVLNLSKEKRRKLRQKEGYTIISKEGIYEDLISENKLKQLKK